MADFSLVLITLLWGTSFSFVKQGLGEASPALFLVVRFALASVVLGAVALARRERPGKDFWRHALWLGVFMASGFVLQTEGLRVTTPSRSGFLTGLSVLIVPFLARFMLGRKVRGASWAGVAFAVAGLFVLTRPFGRDVAAGVRLGDALTALCAVAYAFQITWTAEWSARHPLALLTLVQCVATGAVALAVAPFEPWKLAVNGTLAGIIVFTALVNTALSFFVQNWAQRHTTPVRAALIFSLEPVAAALFSHFYGGESLGPSAWAGGGLIVVGVVVAEVGGALFSRPEAV